jgi:predicted HTH transcriptional regulator
LNLVSSRQADRELIAELRRSAEGVAFDEMPMPALSITDLDLQAAQNLFGATRIIDEKSLTMLKLLLQDQGRLVPSKGAVILFGKERTSHFPDACVYCGRFIGVDKAAIFDHIGGRQRNFTGEVFWARGYFVSTVGLDEEMVRAYIRHQEQEDERYDQMKLGL